MTRDLEALRDWLQGLGVTRRHGEHRRLLAPVFLSFYHLAVWAGVCPGNHESAGKQKCGRARKGNVHLRTMLVGAATSAARIKGTYFLDKFHRLKARRGAMRAALAIAHKILAAFHMLAKGLSYRCRRARLAFRFEGTLRPSR
jgi:transposase